MKKKLYSCRSAYLQIDYCQIVSILANFICLKLGEKTLRVSDNDDDNENDNDDDDDDNDNDNENDNDNDNDDNNNNGNDDEKFLQHDFPWNDQVRSRSLKIKTIPRRHQFTIVGKKTNIISINSKKMLTLCQLKANLI